MSNLNFIKSRVRQPSSTLGSIYGRPTIGIRSENLRVTESKDETFYH